MKNSDVREQVINDLELSEINSGVYYGEWVDVKERDTIESYSLNSH